MPQETPSTARLEAFSDGVIAVIITIMVLEIKVPHQDGAAGLYALFPILLVYLLSFVFTGIYWINHQHLLRRIHSADHAILYANLWFLFCLSLLPFSTSYVLEKKIDPFAVSLYAGSMIVIGFSFLLLRLAIHRNLRLTGKLEAKDMAARGKHLLSLLFYLAAIPLAYLHPQWAMTAIAFVTVIWIIPDLNVSQKSKE